MNGRFLLSTLGLCGIFLTGCAVYDPDLLNNQGTPGQPPPRPDPSTSVPEDSGERAFVITDVTLDQTTGAAWKDIGLNLDGFTTGGDGTPAECTADSPTADGNSGIDNRFGESLWPVIRGRLPSLQCEINWAHSHGHGSLIVQFSKWNGLADDASVVASIVPAVDGTSAAAANCNQITDEELVNGVGDPLPDPLLLGNDIFCLNPDGLAGKIPGGAPLVLDSNAYVSGGALVLSIPETAYFTLYATRSSVGIRLGDGTMVMPMDAAWEEVTGGYVGGRFAINNLTDVGPDIGVCNQADLMPTYEAYADLLDSAPDVVDPAANCNAISIGVSFNAVKATVAGTASTAVPPFQACDMAGPLGMVVVPYPVKDCCSSLSASDQPACDNYWDSMP